VEGSSTIFLFFAVDTLITRNLFFIEKYVKTLRLIGFQIGEDLGRACVCLNLGSGLQATKTEAYFRVTNRTFISWILWCFLCFAWYLL